MSAIVGLYYTDGRSVDGADLQRMAASLAHRGPDGQGVWNHGPVGLGHRMLLTTPESLHETLPLRDQAGSLVITADARIDNRQELIAALGLTHGASPEVTDSQLILAAYERWGERCPEELLGDFAFAVWDGRERVLFCARDPMGVKPLYYHHSSRAFCFASEIKALLCLPEVPRRLEEVRVADYLTANFEDKVTTLYQGICQLPAAHSLTVSRGGVSLRSYWSPDLSREIRLSSDEEYAEAFSEIFTEAVRCRLRGAFPVGSMLSGGLDSSSIVCTAQQVLAAGEGRPLHTFSAVFPSLSEMDPRIDERPFMSAVVASGGIEAHYVHADRLGPLADLEQVLWYADEAVPAPNLYMDWALFRAAHQQGMRIILSGFDGDSTVSHGYEYLAELARTGKWKTLVAEAAALTRRFNAAIAPWRVMWLYGFRPLVPPTAVRMWRVLRGRPQTISAVNSVINPDFARRVGLSKRSKALLDDGSTPARTAREEHWRSLTSGLLVYALGLLDKAATASSLEPRYPFFDRRLIEFCLALPPEQKLHQGWTRSILRRAMAGRLPQEVQARLHKGNLSSHFRLNLLEYERATLEEVILNKPEMIEAYIDVAALRAAYHRYAAEPAQRARDQDALTVFLAVTLALWLRRTGLKP